MTLLGAIAEALDQGRLAGHSLDGRTSSIAELRREPRRRCVASADRCIPQARRVRSSSGICKASWIASAVSDRSNGLIASA